ncbi:MAG: cadherin repeat domain-containing protein, partial [Gammaproteobacteria bacterium]
RYLFDAAALATAADVTGDPAASEPVTADPATQDSSQDGATATVNAIDPALAADLLVDNQVFAISENSPAGTDLFEVTGDVVGDGVIDTQPDVGALDWSITGGSGADVFSITADGKLQVLDPDRLDYETNTSFTLVVHATDQSGGEDETTIDILVGNVIGEAPDINGEVPDQSVLGGSTLTVDIASLANPDDDDGDPINYALLDAPDGASIDPDTGLFTWNTNYDQAGESTITVLISNDFDVDQTSSLEFNVDVEPLLVNVSDAGPVAEGNALVYTVSLNGDTNTAVTATLGFGGGTATGGATDDGTSDYEMKFYSDPALSNEITSVTLGDGNPTALDVYVKTFENNPPYGEGSENVVVLLTDIQNADAGDTSGTGTVTDDSVEPAPPPAPPPVNTINDSTDTGTTARSTTIEPLTEPGEAEAEAEAETELLTEPEEEEAGSEDLFDEFLEEPLEPPVTGEGTSETPSVYSELTPGEIAQLETLIATADFSTEMQSPAAGTPHAEGGDAPPPPRLINEIVQLIKACGT